MYRNVIIGMFATYVIALYIGPDKLFLFIQVSLQQQQLAVDLL